MRKRRILLYILLFALFAAVAATAVGFVRGHKLSARADSIERRIAPDGSVYEIISVGDNRLCLRRLTPDGLVTGYYPLPVSEVRGMYTAYHTIGRLGEELYLYKYETLGNTPERLEEAVVAYDMSSGKSRVVAEIPAPGTLDTYDVYFAQNTSDSAVFLGYLERESGHLTLRRIDAASGEATERPAAIVPFPLAAISIAETGELFALSRDSRVFMHSGEEWTCVFEPSPREAVANMTVSEGDEVFLFAASPDGARVLVSTSQNRGFAPMDFDAGGLIKLHIAETYAWVAMDEAYRYVVFTGGETYRVSELRASFWELWNLNALLIIISSAAVATGLFAAIRLIVTWRRLHLLPKLLIIIIPLFTLGIFVLVTNAKERVEKAVENGLRESILEYAYETVEGLDAERFAGINWDAPFEDEYYIWLQSYIHKLSEFRVMPVLSGGARDTHNAYASYSIYRVDGERVYTVVNGHFAAGLETKYFEYSPRVEGREEMLLRREPVSAILGGTDSDIRWTAVLFPIALGDELVGYLEVARPLTAIDEAAYNVTRGIIRAGLLVFAAVVTALILVLAFSTKTLGKLKRGALAVSGGDYSARVSSKSWDETGEIAAAFNKMAQSVEASVKHITEVSDGYSRFVSDKLIELLGKDSISTLRPGDHKRLTATHLLLYTDSFDKLRDEAFFDALGRFYDVAIPGIASAGGLVSRYSARGITAMFENSPEATLRAVIAVFAALDRVGDMACYAFMSYSGAMLGVTGNGEHLNMITVSRLFYETYSVGTAGKRFGVRLIVPQSAYAELGRAAERYHHRFLGFLRDDGELRRLYDFYDCDTAEIKVKKDATKERFENGVELYYAGEYSKARRIFVDIIKEFPEDTASREFLRMSHAGHESGGEPQPLIKLR